MKHKKNWPDNPFKPKEEFKKPLTNEQCVPSARKIPQIIKDLDPDVKSPIVDPEIPPYNPKDTFLADPPEMPVGEQALTDWQIFATFVGIVIGVFAVVLTGLTGIGMGMADTEVDGWVIAAQVLAHPGYWLICSLIALVAFSSWLMDQAPNKDKS